MTNYIELDADELAKNISVDYELRLITVAVTTTHQCLYSCLKHYFDPRYDFPFELVFPCDKLQTKNGWVIDGDVSIFPVFINGVYLESTDTMLDMAKAFQ